MKEEFVSYEIAQKLKDAGFDWECDRYYTNEYVNDNPEDITKEVKLNIGRTYNHNMVLYSVGPDCSAPTLSIAAKWLREVKGIAINVIAHDGGEYHWSEVYLPNFKEQGYRWYDYREHPLVPTYEKALSDAIDTMLTLLTEKQ